MDPIAADLAALADAHGVAVDYLDTERRRHDVDPGTVIAVLSALGVDASTPDAVTAALADHREAPWRQPLPPSVVVQRGAPATLAVPLHVATGSGVQASVELQDGTQRAVGEVSAPTRRRVVAGVERERRTLRLPADLSVGVHRLTVTTRGEVDDEASSVLIVAPKACPSVTALEPTWGWMLQLYALRSAGSWEIGDLADLRDLAVDAARRGAGFVLVNPLHAIAPVEPAEASPYYPSSRRFFNPFYLRVEDLPEFGAAPAMVQARVQRLAEGAQAHNRDPRIDRDRAWAAKRDALTLLHGVPMERERSMRYAAWKRARGQALEDHATFCALAEEHGTGWQTWPRELRRPHGRAVTAARRPLSQRVAFHTWLQWCVDEQLAEAQQQARGAGMPLGIIHDLAVGVDPGGADAWALQSDLATGVTVGAPPDPFNQRGQDWKLPPLRPDRLVATGYAPFREMLAAALAHAGGVRIDHVMGLFRLWWIPPGAEATAGTYVRYPAQGLMAVLALEAHRAGAVVVGEDLGTVEDGVREALLGAGVASSAVVWFARTGPAEDRSLPLDGPATAGEEARRLRPEEYPEPALASVTTHDLPTAAGWWEDEELHTQERLGLLGAGRTLRTELARKAEEREDLRALLHDSGILDDAAEDDPDVLAIALHSFLARTRSRLVAVQPADAVGDRRQPNLPGTRHEYPNWKLPVAEPAPEGHRPLLLEAFLEHPRVRRMIDVLSEGRAARSPSARRARRG
jgi:4-alpha-glucanotransferase